MARLPSSSGGGRAARAAQIKAELDQKKQEAEQAAAQTGDSSEQGEQAGTGPVGQGEYVVSEGECISSIAMKTGHFWEKIWNDAANEELKEVRKDPNLLLPGDRVTIPEKTEKQEPGETEQRHRFERKGEPSQINMVIEENGEPRANQPYELVVDDRLTRTGTTDPNGRLIENIPGISKRAVLKVGPPEEGPADDIVTYDLDLGAVYPITELAGVQQRLENLGYAPGPIDGEWGPRTAQALRDFQEDNDLPVTGELDDATRDKLEEVHGA